MTRCVEQGNARIAAGRLADLLRRVAAFGIVLARLDIRQESERHTEALDAITRALDVGSYAQWDEHQRLDFLIRELDNSRPLPLHGLDVAPPRCATSSIRSAPLPPFIRSRSAPTSSR